MSIQHDIERAKHRHGPINELRRKLVADVADQLAFETSAEHAVAMHIIGAMTALDGLATIAKTNEQGLALVRGEVVDLELIHSKLGRLLTGLYGETPCGR